MSIELRRNPDGSLKAKYWYGSYMIKGKRHVTALDIPVAGTVPASLKEKGSEEFEASREAAKKALAGVIADAREQRHPEEYVQKLHEIRTGRRIGSIPLVQLPEAWDKAPRKRKGSPRYVQQAHSLFDRFVAFIQKTYTGTETLADVTVDMAEVFMQAERDRNVSGRTCNAALILLRSAFKALGNRANIVRNPFDGIPTLDENTTHRKPFNREELEAILRAAEKDDFTRPIIITGIFTAMRRGDCCTLRWGDVDLDEGFVRVKTSKTGETVEIPMFPLLRAELTARRSSQKQKALTPEAFVFPEQARMFLENAQGITWRVRKVFEAAGFFNVTEDEDETEPTKNAEPDEPEHSTIEVDEKELRERVRVMLDKLTEADGSGQKRAHMKEAFRRYADGQSPREIANVMGMSKSSISLYLHEIEKRTGLRVLPAPKSLSCEQRGAVSTRPEGGARRVSVRDFHSFRVTWITLALSAGVPLELVQRVTGHKTTQVVLKHYFKPGRDAFKKAIEGAIPSLQIPADTDTARLLPEGAEETVKTPREEIVEICRQATTKTWKKDMERITELAKSL